MKQIGYGVMMLLSFLLTACQEEDSWAGIDWGEDISGLYISDHNGVEERYFLWLYKDHTGIRKVYEKIDLIDEQNLEWKADKGVLLVKYDKGNIVQGTYAGVEQELTVGDLCFWKTYEEEIESVAGHTYVSVDWAPWLNRILYDKFMFYPDGTWKLEIRWDAWNGDLREMREGTYKLQGNQLSLYERFIDPDTGEEEFIYSRSVTMQEDMKSFHYIKLDIALGESWRVFFYAKE